LPSASFSYKKQKRNLFKADVILKEKKSFLQPLVEQGLSTRPGFLIFFEVDKKENSTTS